MDESTKLNPCAECASHCKLVLGILLIVLGLRLLGSEILSTKRQK
jgi:hypothetical protein